MASSPALQSTVRPRPGAALRAYRFLSRIGRRKALCVLAIGLWGIAFRLALSGMLPHPQPSAHDEFAYLLGADLMAGGHVAAPPHPLWKFFESVHVLSQPVYAPKYPPAQSAFLALGQVVLGDPFYGVLLSVALFAAAVCWMLQAYVRPVWALLGGAATVLYFGAGHYWTETYWGGAVAALGAALLVGAYGRFERLRPAVFTAIFGLGALLLVLSRPYESSVLILFLCALLLRALWKRRPFPAGRFALTFAGPAAALLIALGYNYAVTGDALEMPYALHREQYSANPAFWFQAPYAPKHYENAAVAAAFEQFERPTYEEIRALPAWRSVGQNLVIILFTVAYDGGALSLLPLLFVPLFWRDPRIGPLAACAGLLLALLTAETFMLLHYLAPLLVVVTLLSCLILERLWGFRKARAADRVLLSVLLVAGLLAGPLWRAGHAMAGQPGQLYKGDGFQWKRAQVAGQLLRQPGRQVVFVRFNAAQNPMHAWVANGADIDESRLVWAHDRGPENQLLRDYFPGRTFWLLEDRAGDIRLKPYDWPAEGSHSAW